MPAALLVVGLLAFTGCGSNDDSGSTSGSASASGTGTASGDCTVGLAINTEVTGALSVYGGPTSSAVQTAVDAINKEGGLKVGDKTCMAEAKIVDNQSDPAKVFQASQEIVDFGPVAVTNADLNEQVSADPFLKAGYVIWTYGFVVKGDRVFHPVPPATQNYVTYLERARAAAQADGSDIKRVSILLPNTSLGKLETGVYTEAAKQLGIEIVSPQLYADDTSDFSTILTKIKQANPDLLIVGDASESVSTALKQAAPQETAPYYLSESITPDVLAEGDLAKLKVFIANFAPTWSPSVPLPGRDYKAVFPDGKLPGVPGAAIAEYYAMRMTGKAVEAAGSTDPAKVAEALKTVSYDGPFGTCRIEGDYMDCPLDFYVVNGPKITVDAYDNFADKEATVYQCENKQCTKQEQ